MVCQEKHGDISEIKETCHLLFIRYMPLGKLPDILHEGNAHARQFLSVEAEIIKVMVSYGIPDRRIHPGKLFHLHLRHLLNVSQILPFRSVPEITDHFRLEIQTDKVIHGYFHTFPRSQWLSLLEV